MKRHVKARIHKVTPRHVYTRINNDTHGVEHDILISLVAYHGERVSVPLRPARVMANQCVLRFDSILAPASKAGSPSVLTRVMVAPKGDDQPLKLRKGAVDIGRFSEVCTNIFEDLGTREHCLLMWLVNQHNLELPKKQTLAFDLSFIQDWSKRISLHSETKRDPETGEDEAVLVLSPMPAR